MKTITTSSGKTLDIKWVLGPISNDQILIDLDGDFAISKLAAKFENQASFRVDDDATPGKYDMYEGYTQLVGVTRMKNKNVTRLTLEKGDAV